MLDSFESHDEKVYGTVNTDLSKERIIDEVFKVIYQYIHSFFIEALWVF